MKRNKQRRQRDQHGSVFIIVVIMVILLLPVMMSFSRWVGIHRRGTTQARVHMKEIYAGKSATDLAQWGIRNGTMAPPSWDPAIASSFVVRVDSGTIVSGQIRSVGNP